MKKFKFTRFLALVFAFALTFTINGNVVFAAEANGTANVATGQKDVAYYRKLLSQMFNADEYAAKYPEVAKKAKGNKDVLFDHFLKNGIYNYIASENQVSDWKARWFTQIIHLLIGDCTGQDVAVLLAQYAANPDNYGKVLALDVIFDSMITTEMPPYEMMATVETKVVEIEPGVVATVIEVPPTDDGGEYDYLILWVISNLDDKNAFENTLVNGWYIIPESCKLIVDENYSCSKIKISDGAELFVNGMGSTVTFSCDNLIIDGLIENFGKMIINGDVNNNGDAGPGLLRGIFNSGVMETYGNVNNGDSAQGTRGYIFNDGTITFDGSGTIVNASDSSISNFGIIISNNDIVNDGSFQNSRDFESNGEIENNGTISNNGEIENNGDIENNGTIFNNGTITGSGNITGNSVQ